MNSLTNWFELYEVLPEEIYNKIFPIYGEDAWRLFNGGYLFTLNALRRRYGKLVANTYHWGGSSQYRGYRPLDCKVGSKLSQHKRLRAVDLIPMETTAANIRADILANRHPEDFKYITGLELDVDWLHIDFREWDVDKNGLYTFYS